MVVADGGHWRWVLVLFTGGYDWCCDWLWLLWLLLEVVARGWHLGFLMVVT